MVLIPLGDCYVKKALESKRTTKDGGYVDRVSTEQSKLDSLVTTSNTIFLTSQIPSKTLRTQLKSLG